MPYDKLFARWENAFPFDAFIRDGIVDHRRYEAPHVLFILRDMNCRSRRNLCEDLRNDGSGWKTWNNVGRWTRALLDGSEEYPRDMPKEKRIEQLKRIAVMNLKKEGGSQRADGKALREAVQTQSELIHEEICLCDPDIIICCGLGTSAMTGNAELLKEFVFRQSGEWNRLRSTSFARDWWYYFGEINGRQIPVISFCHPQVTNLCGHRGHEKLFAPLYRDMLRIRALFLNAQRHP